MSDEASNTDEAFDADFELREGETRNHLANPADDATRKRHVVLPEGETREVPPAPNTSAGLETSTSGDAAS